MTISAGESGFRVRAAGVAWRQTGDEVVVLDIERSEYFGLNGSATRLWLRLQSGATEAELVAVLTTHAAVAVAQAQTDVADFLDALRQRQLVDQV